ncbi:hypothetical protein LTR65_001188 [Meristemomyces frigidus]
MAEPKAFPLLSLPPELWIKIGKHAIDAQLDIYLSERYSCRDIDAVRYQDPEPQPDMTRVTMVMGRRGDGSWTPEAFTEAVGSWLRAIGILNRRYLTGVVLLVDSRDDEKAAFDTVRGEWKPTSLLLLGLPAELWIEIGKKTILVEMRIREGLVGDRWYRVPAAQPAITRLCKIMRVELLPYFYKTCFSGTVRVSQILLDPLYSEMSRWLNAIGPSNRRLLDDVVLRVHFLDNEHFRLLDLPPELWCRICEFAVTAEHPIVLDYHFNDRDLCNSIAQPPLARVNQQLRAETVMLFYDRNTFLVKDETTVAPMLAKWLFAIGPRCGALLRDLAIISDYDDVRAYYGGLLYVYGFAIQRGLSNPVCDPEYLHTYKVSFIGRQGSGARQKLALRNR